LLGGGGHDKSSLPKSAGIGKRRKEREPRCSAKGGGKRGQRKKGLHLAREKLQEDV